MRARTTCQCGLLMHRVFDSRYRTWMWSCSRHGYQQTAEVSTDQLTLEREKGWR
jgi:hypothetical protein